MKKIYTGIVITLIFLLSVIQSCRKENKPAPPPIVAPSSWTRLNSFPGGKVIVLETYHDSLYAASDSNLIYFSTNKGSSWTTSTLGSGIGITALAVFKGRIYVGTYETGIFVSSDNGRSWTVQGVEISPVTSFVVWNDHLYASSLLSSSNAFGAGGIYELDPTGNTWQLFNNAGLPVNHDVDVRKLIVAGQTLLSVQGPNDDYYTYNLALHTWEDNNYFVPYICCANMEDMIYDSGILLGTNGSNIFSKGAPATGWIYDTTDLKKVVNPVFAPRVRALFSDSSQFYVLTNVPLGGTWIQHRSKSAALGSTWAVNEQLLQGNGYSYALREAGGAFFLATDKGIYYKKISP